MDEGLLGRVNTDAVMCLAEAGVADGGNQNGETTISMQTRQDTDNAS